MRWFLDTIKLCANFEIVFCGDKSNLAWVGFPWANQSNLFFPFDHLKFSIIDVRGVNSLVKFRIHFLPLSWAKSYWSGSWNNLCGSTRVGMLCWGTSCRALIVLFSSISFRLHASQTNYFWLPKLFWNLTEKESQLILILVPFYLFNFIFFENLILVLVCFYANAIIPVTILWECYLPLVFLHIGCLSLSYARSLSVFFIHFFY